MDEPKTASGYGIHSNTSKETPVNKMPDLNHSINPHDAVMHQWWRDPEYIRERKAFVGRHPKCVRCGKTCTTPGHSHEDYKDLQTYLNAVKSDKCDPLCSLCNKKERAGLHPCPVCVAQHRANPEHPIHYIRADQEFCGACSPDFNPEKSKQKKELDRRVKQALARDRYNKAHPEVKVVNLKTGKWEMKKR